MLFTYVVYACCLCMVFVCVVYVCYLCMLFSILSLLSVFKLFTQRQKVSEVILVTVFLDSILLTFLLRVYASFTGPKKRDVCTNLLSTAIQKPPLH